MVVERKNHRIPEEVIVSPSKELQLEIVADEL